jgi:acetyl/propionyl-CoA carboxylase alpha subunit
MRMLGDKVLAKRLAEKVDVPVVHGVADQSSTRRTRPPTLRCSVTRSCSKLRPAVVAAEFDGRASGRAARALAAARSEAELALAIQRCSSSSWFLARHVSQIVADAHGTTWAVGVRDCSIQRRNQR